MTVTPHLCSRRLRAEALQTSHPSVSWSLQVTSKRAKGWLGTACGGQLTLPYRQCLLSNQGADVHHCWCKCFFCTVDCRQNKKPRHTGSSHYHGAAAEQQECTACDVPLTALLQEACHCRAIKNVDLAYRWHEHACWVLRAAAS